MRVSFCSAAILEYSQASRDIFPPQNISTDQSCVWFVFVVTALFSMLTPSLHSCRVQTESIGEVQTISVTAASSPERRSPSPGSLCTLCCAGKSPIINIFLMDLNDYGVTCRVEPDSEVPLDSTEHVGVFQLVVLVSCNLTLLGHSHWHHFRAVFRCLQGGKKY